MSHKSPSNKKVLTGSKIRHKWWNNGIFPVFSEPWRKPISSWRSGTTASVTHTHARARVCACDKTNLSASEQFQNFLQEPAAWSDPPKQPLKLPSNLVSVWIKENGVKRFRSAVEDWITSHQHTERNHTGTIHCRLLSLFLPSFLSLFLSPPVSPSLFSTPYVSSFFWLTES